MNQVHTQRGFCLFGQCTPVRSSDGKSKFSSSRLAGDFAPQDRGKRFNQRSHRLMTNPALRGLCRPVRQSGLRERCENPQRRPPSDSPQFTCARRSGFRRGACGAEHRGWKRDMSNSKMFRLRCGKAAAKMLRRHFNHNPGSPAEHAGWPETLWNGRIRLLCFM